MGDKLLDAQAALVRCALEARGIDPAGLKFKMDMHITAYSTGKMVITLTAAPEKKEGEGR